MTPFEALLAKLAATHEGRFAQLAEDVREAAREFASPPVETFDAGVAEGFE